MLDLSIFCSSSFPFDILTILFSVSVGLLFLFLCTLCPLHPCSLFFYFRKRQGEGMTSATLFSCWVSHGRPALACPRRPPWQGLRTGQDQRATPYPLHQHAPHVWLLGASFCLQVPTGALVPAQFPGCTAASGLTFAILSALLAL